MPMTCASVHVRPGRPTDASDAIAVYWAANDARRGGSDLCRLIVLADGRSKGAGKTKNGGLPLVWRPSGRGARILR